MPRKPANYLTPEQLLNKIRQSAKEAARRGQTCYDKETLKAKRSYTDEQADAYISTYNEKAGTPQEQAIRKARCAAQNAAARGAPCPTKEALLEKNYTEQASDAYLATYQVSKGTDEKQAIKRARYTAQTAATHGVPCPTKEALIKKGYTEQTSDAYLAAYKESKDNDENQAIRKARQAGQRAAACGAPCPTKEALLEKDYTEQASDTYLAVYEAAKGSDEKQAIKRARHAAQMAAGHGTPCPTKEALIERGYTEQASDAYLAAYKESKDNDEKQAIRKARCAAQRAAACGAPCPTKEALLEKDYTEQASDAYLAAYEAAKGTDEEQAIKRARYAAQMAAGHGIPCPTKEVLIKRGYFEQASDAYVAAYQASKKVQKTNSTREALQELQDILNNSSETNDYVCIASFLDSLGYQEDTSLTEQEEQYLAEVLGEESTNSNRLLFNFTLTETTSLTISGFLSSFEEENDEKNAVTVAHPSQVLR